MVEVLSLCFAAALANGMPRSNSKARLLGPWYGTRCPKLQLSVEGGYRYIQPRCVDIPEPLFVISHFLDNSGHLSHNQSYLVPDTTTTKHRLYGSNASVSQENGAQTDDKLSSDSVDCGMMPDTGVSPGYTDPYVQEIPDTTESAFMPSDSTSDASDQSNRFGKPRFLSGTKKIIDAAKSKLKRLFNWGHSNANDTKNELDTSDKEERQYHTTKPYTDAEVLALPYVESKKINLSFNRWPDNCFIRIRLESNHSFLVNLAVERLIRGIREHTNLQVGNAKPMPKRRKRWCLLSSPHVDKRSKDLFEIEQHVRFLDVFPAVTNKDPVPSENSQLGEVSDALKDDINTFKGTLMVPLPSMVSFDYWFEEVHKPVKNKSIERTFHSKIWISKYFLHNYEKRKKAEIIDELTSPELYPEIPLRWKRHPCDYFALQLGELQKMHKFVVTRKAEDEARKRYGVKMPKYMDIGEIRFVPNDEDRRCGYISSDDDDEGDIARQLNELENKAKEKSRKY
ncbi:Ribosomal protein S10p/S20e family protein [Babesia bovis T2Bo]|uniref:Small ribosomal subunit protein uS10 domain-containing protein n=1 Tax=Babesia bovis TaxID=5865 RepID=A7APL6_BABBO|nr:Ribosomal protein S10p/S20e family protein [Babesia bovis T2Bo]EDO08500.1 Ribosomal protein S10p/S20e family protein [Babesia bovis T2Bo]|eukprot:XP_001612068.1 hypothetical protein [Babesia bovis T2Bo]